MRKRCNAGVWLWIVTGLLLTGVVRGQTPSGQTDVPPVRKDALWHLQQTPRPVFREGHTLIPLSRWGWAMPYPVKIELCEYWGYALEFGEIKGGNIAKVAKLDDPNSEESRLCALTASDPRKYPLAVIIPRPVNQAQFHATFEDPEMVWCRDENGQRFANVPAWKTWSPEVPDAFYEKAAKTVVEPLLKIKAKAPIAILLDGGENGLGVMGHCLPYWSQDPRVLAAKGDQEWFDYISKRKAHQQGIITDAVRAAFPNRQLYVWYHFGFMPGALAKQWTYDYQPMRAVSDMPGQSIYYKHFNTGWTGKNDLLTNYLASVAIASEFSDTLSYNWVCAGWKGPDNFSERDRYMGFLKCLYTGGQIGAVAGYFSHPKVKGGFNAELGDTMPSWLTQMIDLGHAQALFSHVEDFIREGDLLPGPEMNRLVPSVAACEFPTGDADARVVARKHRQREEWLITAWAASGDSRQITVSIPDLGDVTVSARPCGSVYRATLKQVIDHEPPAPVLELLDKDGMNPTAGFAKE